MAGTEASPREARFLLVSIPEEVSLREEVALAGWDTLGAGTHQPCSIYHRALLRRGRDLWGEFQDPLLRALGEAQFRHRPQHLGVSDHLRPEATPISMPSCWHVASWFEPHLEVLKPPLRWLHCQPQSCPGAALSVLIWRRPWEQ